MQLVTRDRPSLITLLVAFGLSMASALPAWAHTEVLRAVPGPGERVSGVVDSVQLTFLGPVLPAVTMTVADGDGDPVAGLGEPRLGEDARSAQVDFDPVGPGDYVVDYEFSAIDGDTQRETYRFSRIGSVAGGPPAASSPDDVSEGEPEGLTAIAVAVGVLGILVVAATVAVRRRRTAGQGV